MLGGNNTAKQRISARAKGGEGCLNPCKAWPRGVLTRLTHKIKIKRKGRLNLARVGGGGGFEAV